MLTRISRGVLDSILSLLNNAVNFLYLTTIFTLIRNFNGLLHHALQIFHSIADLSVPDPLEWSMARGWLCW